jgi:hypothetical protein
MHLSRVYGLPLYRKHWAVSVWTPVVGGGTGGGGENTLGCKSACTPDINDVWTKLSKSSGAYICVCSFLNSVTETIVWDWGEKAYGEDRVEFHPAYQTVIHTEWQIPSVT